MSKVKYSIGATSIVVFLVISGIMISWVFEEDYTTLYRDGLIIARHRWHVEAERTYINKNSWYRANVMCPKIITSGGYETATRCYYPSDYYEQLSRSLINTNIEVVNETDTLLIQRFTPFYKYGTSGAYAGILEEETLFRDTSDLEMFPESYNVFWNPRDTRNYKLVWRVWNLKEINLPDGNYTDCVYEFGKVMIDLKDDCSSLERAEVINNKNRVWFYFNSTRGIQNLNVKIVDPPEPPKLEKYSIEIPTSDINETGENVTVTKWFYNLYYNNLRIETPAHTKCVWSNPNADRICYHEFTLTNNLTDFRLTWDRMKKLMKFQYPERINLGEMIIHTPIGSIKSKNLKTYLENNVITIKQDKSYTFSIEFNYPANAHDEWNLTFNAPDGTDMLIDPEIDSCTAINGSGIYNMNQSISNGATYCINISTSNVTFDCKGYTLDATSGADYGIYVNFLTEDDNANITIRNCVMTDWDTFAIYFDDAGTINISNVSATNLPDAGIRLYDCDGCSLSNFTITSVGASYSRGRGNTKVGIYNYNSGNTTIKDGYINSFQTGIYDDYKAANSYHNYTNIDIDDSRPYDVYVTASNSANANRVEFNNVRGSVSDKPVIVYSGSDYDNQNVTTNNWSQVMLARCSKCGIENVVRTGAGTISINDAADAVIQNNSLTGLTLIKEEGRNNYFINNTITNTVDETFYFEYDRQYTYLVNNTFDNYDTNQGIVYVKYKGDLRIYGNMFKVDTATAIMTTSWSDNWDIYNNLFNGTTNSYFVIDDEVSDINLYITQTSGDRPNFIPGLDPGIIGGNYYTNTTGDGFSDTCADSNTDGFCDTDYIEDGLTDSNTYSDEYVVPVGDTCDTCTIDCTENCVVDSELDCSNGDLTFTGSGTIGIEADIKNYANVLLSGGCNVICSGGYCIV